MTVEPKIPGAVIPRRVFTQPGSDSAIGRCRLNVRFTQKRTLGAIFYEYTRPKSIGTITANIKRLFQSGSALIIIKIEQSTLPDFMGAGKQMRAGGR